MASSKSNELQWEFYEGPHHDRRPSRKRRSPDPNEPQHRCDMCNRSFNRPSALAKHILSHTGERPHACLFCGMRFVTTSNMFRHMRGCPEKPDDILVDERFVASVQSSSSQSPPIRFATGSSSRQRKTAPSRGGVPTSPSVSGLTSSRRGQNARPIRSHSRESSIGRTVPPQTFDFPAHAPDATGAFSMSTIAVGGVTIQEDNQYSEGAMAASAYQSELPLQTRAANEKSFASSPRRYCTWPHGSTVYEDQARHADTSTHEWEEDDSRSSTFEYVREHEAGASTQNMIVENTIIIDPRLRHLGARAGGTLQNPNL